MLDLDRRSPLSFWHLALRLGQPLCHDDQLVAGRRHGAQEQTRPGFRLARRGSVVVEAARIRAARRRRPGRTRRPVNGVVDDACVGALIFSFFPPNECNVSFH